MADALSRRHEREVECSGVTMMIPIWIQEVTKSYKEDTMAEDKIQTLLLNPSFDPNFKYNNGVLKY